MEVLADVLAVYKSDWGKGCTHLMQVLVDVLSSPFRYWQLCSPWKYWQMYLPHKSIGRYTPLMEVLAGVLAVYKPDWGKGCTRLVQVLVDVLTPCKYWQLYSPC